MQVIIRRPYLERLESGRDRTDIVKKNNRDETQRKDRIDETIHQKTERIRHP